MGYLLWVCGKYWKWDLTTFYWICHLRISSLPVCYPIKQGRSVCINDAIVPPKPTCSLYMRHASKQCNVLMRGVGFPRPAWLMVKNSEVHEANMGPTWVLSGPGGPHVGPMSTDAKNFRQVFYAIIWLGVKGYFAIRSVWKCMSIS